MLGIAIGRPGHLVLAARNHRAMQRLKRTAEEPGR